MLTFVDDKVFNLFFDCPIDYNYPGPRPLLDVTFELIKLHQNMDKDFPAPWANIVCESLISHIVLPTYLTSTIDSRRHLCEAFPTIRRRPRRVQ